MVNLLPDEWLGEWTDPYDDGDWDNGYGSSDLEGAQVSAATDVYVNEDGLLVAQLMGTPETLIRVPRTSQGLRIDQGTDLSLRLAMQYSAGAEIRVQVNTMDPSWGSTLTIKSETIENVPGEPLQVAFDGMTKPSNGGTHTQILVRLIKAGAGELKIAPVWIGDPADAPEEIEWPGDDDDEDEDEEEHPPEPGELEAELAPKVAAYVGQRDNTEMVEQIEGQLFVIIEFVRGYTRGHGFHPETDRPEKALQACIVSAAARVATNPEQIFSYQQGDYSERGAQLTGFTLIEQRTLNNYRRRWA